jgi:hypothetical protein
VSLPHFSLLQQPSLAHLAIVDALPIDYALCPPKKWCCLPLLYFFFGHQGAADCCSEAEAEDDFVKASRLSPYPCIGYLKVTATSTAIRPLADSHQHHPLQKLPDSALVYAISKFSGASYRSSGFYILKYC